MAGSRIDWLVVGLGNPGARYDQTRHNIGFDVADALARRWSVQLTDAHKGMYGEAALPAGRVGLLKPLTYMNLSGESVARVMQQTRVPAERIVVLQDEVDLPPGELRYKYGGGLAGHNGLKSIAAQLGSNDFHRIRIGVGRPPAGDPRPVKAWVLGRFEPEIDTARMIDGAVGMAADLVAAGTVEPARVRVFEPLP